MTDDALFCSKCGAPKWDGDALDPYSDAAMAQRGMKLCTTCRSEIGRAATVCDRCGALQPAIGEGGSVPMPPPTWAAPVFTQPIVAVDPAQLYASIPRRGVAFVIDMVVVFMLAVAVLVVYQLGHRSHYRSGNDRHWHLSLLLGLYLGYFIIAEGWTGQTVGKRLADLRVVDSNGGPISWGQSVGRNLLRIIDSLPFALHPRAGVDVAVSPAAAARRPWSWHYRAPRTAELTTQSILLPKISMRNRMNRVSRS